MIDLVPGPLLFQNNPDIVYGIFCSLILANIIMLAIGVYGNRLFIKVVSVPEAIMYPLIDLARSAKESGADATLSVVPYYNKPSQEGLYQHFKAITEAVDIPVILYNVPSRTVTNMLPETVARLAGFDNIIGIKEASGSIFNDYVGALKSGNIFSINVEPNYDEKLRDIDVKTLRAVGKMIKSGSIIQ